ncbi:MAG: DUF4173 domain-containing protein [Clostridia bacterium]|nr:DUF4173 domain-containing protein [Clostridia bacterium]
MNDVNLQNQEPIEKIDPIEQNDNAPITDLRDYDAFECVFAWLCILIGYLFCCAFPPTHFPLGSFIVSVFCVVTTALTLVKRKARLGATEWFLAVLSLAFSFAFMLNISGFPTFIAFVCALICYGFFVYRASGNRLSKGNSDFLPLELLRALKGFSVYAIADMFRLMFARKNKSFKAILKILIGLIAAVIPTAIVISLLSYDGRFSELLKNAFSFIIDFDFAEQLAYISFGTVIAMYIFGMYAVNTSNRKPLNCEAMRERSERVRVAPLLTVAATLLPLAVVYLFFFVSQWDYYLSAFTGKLPEGVVNYAEYARSGFFELCTVSAINLAIITAIALFMKRSGNGEKIFLRIVSALFSVMTLVLIGTALAKMYLYIDRFGLTAKRLLSSWLMIVIALIFVFVIIRSVVKKFPLFVASTVAVVLMCGVLVASDYNSFIANYNVDRYISGKTDVIDVTALIKADTPAIPAITKLMEHCQETGKTESYDYKRLEREICDEIKRLENQNDIFSFSFPSNRAEEAIEEFCEKYPLEHETEEWYYT